ARVTVRTGASAPGDARPRRPAPTGGGAGGVHAAAGRPDRRPSRPTRPTRLDRATIPPVWPTLLGPPADRRGRGRAQAGATGPGHTGGRIRGVVAVPSARARTKEAGQGPRRTGKGATPAQVAASARQGRTRSWAHRTHSVVQARSRRPRSRTASLRAHSAA